MRTTCLLALLALASYQLPAEAASPKETAHSEAGTPAAIDPISAKPELSVVRINSTRQGWNPGQPWEKLAPRRRRSLGAIVANHQILTTAEMVADATFIELETINGKHFAPAKIVAVDYEANLALLGLESPDTDASFFDGSAAFKLAEPSGLGDVISIIQVEENGTPLITSGPVQSIDLISNFLPGQYFITYEVKASMQSAASSFSLPAIRDGKLVGLLTSYNSKDQLSDVCGTEIVTRFLADAADGDYQGFPSLGISTSRTIDSSFRAWLKLPADDGGLYVSTIRKGSAADKSGLKKGDVITTIDGHEIDRMGYFDHQLYGRLFWSHLVRGAKGAGESVTLGIIRNGKTQELTAQLERRKISNEIVPSYTFGQAPNFLVKGGLVFQELTIPLLQSYGEEWQARAPLNLLDVIENPEKYEDKIDHAVFLAGVIATPATVGYEPLRNLIVTEVNGKPIRNMKGLIAAFDAVPEDGLHSIEFDQEKFKVYLDEIVSTAVDTQLIERGLTRLSRTENE